MTMTLDDTQPLPSASLPMAGMGDTGSASGVTNNAATLAGHGASYASLHHDNLISLPLPLEETLYRQLDIAFILLWHKRNNYNTKVLWLRDEIKRLYHEHMGEPG